MSYAFNRLTSVGRMSRRGARGWVLAAVVLTAALPVGAGAQPAPYNGVQPRTPVDQIPAGGQMRNFTLIGQNPLIDPQMGIPRSMNGGMAAAKDCVYIGSNIGLQPALIVDIADPTNPTIVGPLPNQIQGKGNGIESIEAVPDLGLLAVSIRASFTGQGPSGNAVLLGSDPPPADMKGIEADVACSRVS